MTSVVILAVDPPPPPPSTRYSPEDVYRVVADVNSYKLFLPWCKDSLYLREAEHKSMVRLVVGFPPLMESYTALVLADPPHSLRVCNYSITNSRTKMIHVIPGPFPDHLN